MRDRQVTIVAWEPPDRDQVARHVQPALRAKDDVVQGWVFDEAPADTAARSVAFDHQVSHLCGDQTQALKFQFISSLPAGHWPHIR